MEKDTHKRVGPRRERDTFQGLSQNSKVSYFNKLRACINQAYDDQIIPVNPLRGIEGFKEEEVKRDYLTLDEVKKLAATPCRYPVLKRAFLFSCLTGLRKSDIQKLTWGEVQKFGKYTRIVFKQRKTKGQEYLDISSQAEKYLGERGNPDDIVFTGFTYGSWTSLELQRWSLAAGVNKNLTFHSYRRTYATLQGAAGTDIRTIQSNMAHKSITTTQRYMKVVDSNKREASNRISLIRK